ncbi:MAG: GUN4 domain-containing protein [Pseudanabaena sp. M090S1SP1A06QC]|nr:GUN4 domain-containing protein [Pseudanabaena sp. M051S1SP1A06QC]MCA6590483.1 GUN4 domain-containing protein [Pseudanabaena sp. M109S1SP1A06QC]MCA6613716.1 GUN4 domain-containing protein [Pseudanabaena sp. M090S1SP1A06QC]MCA6622557.1 GUN4 domain-containing protein [Pseudanabaena sp. M165S2SP1A06QC]
MIGRLLDRRYRIMKELAEGGFSQTYLAEDTRLPKNPKCVVKHLNPTIDDPIFTQKALELFKAEAETLQELGRHDRIPQLYAYFQENKEFYLVQEYIAGHPLSTEMLPGSQMAEARVAQIIKEVLEILQFVHHYNVIHRDIKPSNLIRRHSDGKLVLIDFGTVKQVQMEVANAHHKARVTLPIGTLGYMSYEQERGQSVSSSDIYSLGMVALQALTGKHPSQFSRDRDNEIIWHKYAKVTRDFATILDRMIRCNPRDRYQTVDEVLKDMAKLPKLSTASPRITDDREVPPRPWLLPSAIACLIIATGSYLFATGWNPLRYDNSITIKPTASPAPLPSSYLEAISPQAVPIIPIDRNYAQLRSYLDAKDWKEADNETYLSLLKAAGNQSYNDGSFHPDEFKQISCADLVLIDQLWTQASNGKLGLSAQKKLYTANDKDIHKTYEVIGWMNSFGELVIETAYNRQTSRWDYLESRQPNFKAPPTGHLPFLLRDPANKNLEKVIAVLYRCSS